MIIDHEEAADIAAQVKANPERLPSYNQECSGIGYKRAVK